MTAEQEPSAIVSLRGVTKSYDGISLVVRHLDLDIKRGEFLTLLGPSGSGKTTTLMMLAGFETPTTGEILLEGRSVTHQPPHRRGIGMVFQNYALFPHMTVAENLAFPLEVRKIPRAEIATKVAKALNMVRLGTLGDRRPSQLSGGQQQRVALARALVFEPSLVLMDEPLGALDKQLREHMQYEIRALHERLGVTFVYVTHDQIEALAMSDRIAVFHEGIIHQLASAQDLYERPANAFVASFIGESNSLPGKVVDLCDGTASVALSSTSIKGRRADVDAVGEEAIVSTRPERLRLLRRGETAANVLDGTVREIIYLGDHLRVVVSIASVDCVVKLANTSEVKPNAVGEAVRIGFEPGDCVILKRSAA